MQTSGHNSHPDIIAWPTLSNENSKLLPTLTKQTQKQFYTAFNTSSNANATSAVHNTHVKSVSPTPNSFATISVLSPYMSPHTSPIFFKNEQKADLAKEEANLLSMIRAAVSSSPSTFLNFFKNNLLKN